jgi:hypothetical protein
MVQHATRHQRDRGEVDPGGLQVCPSGAGSASQRAGSTPPPQPDPGHEASVGELVLVSVGQVDEADCQQAGG